MHEITVLPEDVATGITIRVTPWIKIIEGPPPKKTEFNLTEAAAYLGMSTQTLKELCPLNRICFDRPHYRRFNFRLSGLETFRSKTRIPTSSHKKSRKR